MYSLLTICCLLVSFNQVAHGQGLWGDDYDEATTVGEEEVVTKGAMGGPMTPPADPIRNAEAPALGDSEYDTEGWQCTDGWAIEGHNLLPVLQMVTLDECKQACVDNADCVSVELGQHLRPVKGDVTWCILGDWTTSQAEDQFLENKKYMTTCDRV